MGLIKKLKTSIAIIILSVITVTLSGCVYANNKSWNDMSIEEKQEVKETFLKEIKEDLEEDFSGEGFENELASYLLNVVETAFDNLD